MDTPTVTVFDEKGRSLSCYIEQTLELEGDEYVLLLPVDSPVEIFAWQGEAEDDEEPILVNDEAELDVIFPTACAVLQEQNLVLKRTAVTLTVEGELPDFDEDELDLLDDNGSENGFVEDLEELQLLANFYHEEQEYSVYTPLDPLFILARMDDNGKPKLLTPEEIEKLEPVLSAMEDQFFDSLEE